MLRGQSDPAASDSVWGMPRYLRAERETPVRSAPHAADLLAIAAPEGAGPTSALPHLPRIQRSLGTHDVTGVRAQRDSSSAAACRELGARAFAIGTQVVFAREPDLHTAAHEAAHVVQQARGASHAGEASERHANAVADAVVASRSAQGLLDAWPRSGAPSQVLMRKTEMPETSPPNSAEFRFVPIDKGGKWEALTILEQISQREHTETRTFDPLPGSGRESDDVRCAANAVLASAIVKGPRQVMTLCLNLYKRIVEKRDQSRAAGKNAKGLSVGVCDRAAATVFAIYINLDLGIRYGSHQGGGCTLTFADFDRLANWMYHFTFASGLAWRGEDSEVLEGRKRFRTEAEIEDTAKLSGYVEGEDQFIQKQTVTEESQLKISLGFIKPGESLIGMWGPHTYTFFRAKDGQIYLYDSWRDYDDSVEDAVQKKIYKPADSVHAQGTPEYEQRVQLGLTGKFKPIVLMRRIRRMLWMDF